jgi:flagellar capping protein FliD
MTPQEKAKELVDKYDETLTYLESKSKAKQCALIAVDELIEQQEKYNNGSFYPSNYWNEVKEQIEKIII